MEITLHPYRDKNGTPYIPAYEINNGTISLTIRTTDANPRLTTAYDPSRRTFHVGFHASPKETLESKTLRTQIPKDTRKIIIHGLHPIPSL